MNSQQVTKLQMFQQVLLGTEPTSRIPRQEVERKLREQLCYEQRQRRQFTHRHGDVVLVRR